MIDPRFPFGMPVNRKPEPGLVAIPGRPGWWRHQRTGEEKYIEPQKPPTQNPLSAGVP